MSPCDVSGVTIGQGSEPRLMLCTVQTGGPGPSPALRTCEPTRELQVFIMAWRNSPQPGPRYPIAIPDSKTQSGSINPPVLLPPILLPPSFSPRTPPQPFFINTKEDRLAVCTAGSMQAHMAHGAVVSHHTAKKHLL
ncbi:unnamed protein product [Gadus morhua 'NCC']